jgi:hypothetical protein
LFEKLVWLMGSLSIVFGIFGVSSIRTLKKNVAAQAKARVDEALVEVNAKAKEELAKALLDMKSRIDSAVAHTAETAENARDLLLNVAEATRNYTLANAFAEATIDKQEYYESAVNSCLRAREAAKRLGDTKQIAWTFSFEAYGSMKSYARSEKDFDRWRQSGLYPELVGGKGGTEPGGG